MKTSSLKLTVMPCLILLLVSLPAASGTLEVTTSPIEVTAQGLPKAGTLTLDLAAAYEMALRRNLDVQVGRYGLAAADAGILQNTGVFDPDLTFGLSGDFEESPAATELAGADVTESRNTSLGLGITQLLPTGTQLTLDSGFTRSETNSDFFFLNPRWGSDVTMRLNQPLLNGFGTLVNRSGIIIARNARDQNAAGFEATVVSTLQAVENAYWDLVAAREAVKVNQQGLELATRLLNETKERVKVGTSAAIDLVQSEAGVATRRQELIYSRNAAANAEDALKAVLGFNLPEEWELGIVTSESYDAEPLATDLRQSITTALERRPLVQQKNFEIDYLELNLKLAENAILPRLDLEARYGYSGIGGDFSFEDETTGEVITVSGGFNDSWRQIREADFPHWTLGVQLSMPIGNHEAKGTVAQRKYELDKGRAELDALRQQIIREVRTAVRALDDGAAAIEAAMASRDFGERNLQAEQTKFANGLSTNYQVLEIQEDLEQALLSELQARIDYRKAMVGYRAATGTLLDTYGVQIKDPGQPKAPNDYWKNVKWMQFVNLKKSTSNVTKPAEPVTAEEAVDE